MAGSNKISIRDITTDYIGMWYHSDEHRYTSASYNLANLRDYKGNVRFFMYKNLWHKKGDNRPSFSIRIAGSNAENVHPITIGKMVRDYGLVPGESYVSVGDATRVALEAMSMVRMGYEDGDALAPQDFWHMPSYVEIPSDYDDDDNEIDDGL